MLLILENIGSFINTRLLPRKKPETVKYGPLGITVIGFTPFRNFMILFVTPFCQDCTTLQFWSANYSSFKAQTKYHVLHGTFWFFNASPITHSKMMLISGTHRPYFNWLCNISPLYPSVLGAWALSSSPPRFSGSSLAPFYMTTRIEMVCTKASSWLSLHIRQTFHVTHTARRSYQGVLMTSSYPPSKSPIHSSNIYWGHTLCQASMHHTLSADQTFLFTTLYPTYLFHNTWMSMPFML